MKCSNCGSEWKSENSAITKCPFCGAEILTITDLIRFAEQGDPEMQNKLAGCYYTGDGVSKDFCKAAEWYKKAADQGNNTAQHNLGVCYYYGKGVKKIIIKH